MNNGLGHVRLVSTGQILILMFHFLLGNAVIINLDSEVERNTWIVQLIAMVAGMMLFRMYTYTAEMFPGQSLTTYARELVGNTGGTVIGMMYILFFMYLTSRNLRDETELVRVNVLEKTPSLIVAFLMVICVIYVLWLGFEVLARTGQIFLMVVVLVIFFGNTLLILSGSIHLEELMPVMNEGFKPILHAVIREHLAFPYGEMICFMMFIPCVRKPSQITRAGYVGILVGGIVLVEAAILNVTVLGADITERSIFPLLSTFANVQLSEYVQRPDVIILMSVIIGDFFKVALFFYATAIGISDIFGLPYRKTLFSCGIIILLWSQIETSNLSEHFEFGRQSLIFIHPLFVYIVPFLLFLIALRRRSRGGDRGRSGNSQKT
ncbi:GerAB/ArcD/ProY family transporter [Paenibacillus sp. FSL R10-2782]|uniref:GerAB/ArcD/ProY family transporter n=1 Tax=Paenibacillus sp. FSL R10-2782 TaxID=2954661 RepID=UPI00315883EC